MNRALARHDEIIERLVAGHGGQVVRPRGEGDSRFAVFARASDAVAAACAVQLAVLEERWPLNEPLQVRIAVHTGESELRQGDYYGPAVNHCARLRAIAHGGQVLVSGVTTDLLREALSNELSLRDLGRHSLKDLEQPERVWQLLHSRLPSDFPPLKSLNARRDNLPNQLTSFVGRKETIAELRRLLVSSRLLTLTGPGGVGKTRLALAVAEAVLPDYADGVWFAELAPLSDPALVPSTMATVLRVPESSGPLVDQLAEAVRSKAMLVVLDNCEHLVHACAELSERLLRAAPDVQILATSRQPLGAEGEVACRVPALSVDEPARSDVEAEATRLFVERAEAVAPGFRLTARREAVSDVCRQLDGIPLAIELAAARVNVLTPDQIAARMGDRFRLLVSPGRTVPPRQQTLRAAVDWSYGLLSVSEQTLFSRMSVFAGGCTLEAAEAVCADTEHPAQIARENVLDLIGRLVDQSLVEVDSTDGTIRFRLLETLRQYAGERLHAAGQQPVLRNRHLDWCLKIAESVWSSSGGHNQALWSARVDREHDNIRAALGWALGNSSDTEPPLRLAAAMYLFWWRRGHVGEGRAWLRRALDLDERVGTSLSVAARQARMRALRGAGILTRELDYVASARLFSASLALARELGDAESIAECLYWLGANALYRGDPQRARALAEESIEWYRHLTDPERAKYAQIHGPLSLLAALALQNGDSARAKVLLEERLRSSRDASDPRAVAFSLVALGSFASQQGEHTRAKELLETGRECLLKLGDRSGTASVNHAAARAARERGDSTEAEEQLGEGLRIYRDFGDLWGTAQCLEGLAVIAGDSGHSERAAQLFGSASGLRETIGIQLSPQYVTKREPELDALRAALGSNRFESAWQMGRELPVGEAIDLALRTDSRQPSIPVAAPNPLEASPLTPRELEVVRLIVGGRSNREIAEELVIAVSTAERHVANILNKLNLKSRAQVVAWGVGRGGAATG
jgi:predicted ATPase/DNA-binding CsgD family transcriptional regulator